MEKNELLKSLGFTDDCLGKLNEFQTSQPQFINSERTSGNFEVKTYDSDNLIVNYNPNHNYSSIIIK